MIDAINVSWGCVKGRNPSLRSYLLAVCQRPALGGGPGAFFRVGILEERTSFQFALVKMNGDGKTNRFLVL